MDTTLLAGLAAFAFVTSITPGPNNLMLMASGANFGLRRTLPHLLGVALGFVFMVIVVGLGIAELLERHPIARRGLEVASVLYLLYLAWRIATAAAPGEADPSGRPFSFLEAAAFQWVNPKAWAMALTAVGAYTASRDWPSVVAVALVFGAINLPSVGAWALLGRGMRRALTSPARLRAFNVAMALLLVASLWPVVFG